MNYHESARTRKTGLSTLILNKVMSGGSVGSSIKGAISDRMQASVMGLKEKFDPLNIASKLTGGSRLGPALLGRMTGRSKEDIDYFAHNRRVHRFDNVMNKGQGSGDSKKSIEALENIYSFMVKTRESQIKDNHSTFKFEDERQKANQRRHDEVMEVFNEATKRNRQAVKVIAKPKAVEKPPEAAPAAPPTPPKPGVSPKPEPAKPAPPSAPAPTPAKPTVKPTEPAKAPPEVVKPPVKPVEPVKAPEVTKPIETAKPVPKVEPAPPSAAPAPPAVKPPPSAAPAPPAVKPPPSAAPVKPITEVAKTVAKLPTGESIKDMIMRHEGFKLKPYKDTKELWTIGVGHLIGDGKTLPKEWDRTFTKKEVDDLFDQDYEHHKKAAEKIPAFSKMNEIGQAALIDLTFNMGPSWFKKWPTLMKQLDAKDSEGAAKNLEQSPWYKQVGNRASEIVAMIRKGFDNLTNDTLVPEKIPNSKIEDMSIDNAEMKKLMRQQSSAQAVIMNNTTNVSNRETTVMPGSDKGSENPHYGRK